MNTRNMIVILAVVLAGVTAACAQEGQVYPHIGVSLDSAPLPDLLTKHLGLKPDQGIRIRNVSVNSPADKNGLERDDIIIGFQGRDVTGPEAFVEAVRGAGTETEVSLDIIHLGQRKTLRFKLELSGGDIQWKHPAEPEMVTSWQPGKFFQVGPDGDKWLEMSFNQMPDVDAEVKKFFTERYSTHHTTDGRDYTITIEGDPKDDDTPVVLHVDGTEHSATIGNLDALPEEYREVAREAVEGARQSASQRVRLRKGPWPSPPRPETYRRFFQDWRGPEMNLDGMLRQKEQAMQELEKQMDRLRQRMEEMEKRHLEMFDHLRNKKAPSPQGDAPAEDKAPGEDKAPAVPTGKPVA